MKKPISSKKEQLLYNKTAKQKVLEVLFRYPDKEFSLTDLAKEAGVRKSNIGSIITEFKNAGLLEIIKLSNIWRIRASRNWMFIMNKRVFNLNLIYQSGVVNFLMDYFNNPKSIILFGSFRLGEDITSSDIDIAVEINDKKYESIRMKELASFEDAIGKKIQMHLFNRDAVDINLFNNIANGIVLRGFLEVKP